MTSHRLLKLIASATADQTSELRRIVAILASDFPDIPRTEIEAALMAAQKSAAASCSRREMIAAARELLSGQAVEAA